MGNNEEIFKLSDGTIWQVKYEYEYLYEYYPSVIICPQKGILIIGDRKLNVELVSGTPSKSNRNTTPNSDIKTNDFTEIINYLRDSKIIAQDAQNTYLGKLSSEFNSESIFNEFGTYGNEFSSQSIWNEFSTFGNEFNIYSPFNNFSTQPPMLIKNGKIIGFLTTNKSIENGISPNLLKAIKEDF